MSDKDLTNALDQIEDSLTELKQMASFVEARSSYFAPDNIVVFARGEYDDRIFDIEESINTARSKLQSVG